MDVAIRLLLLYIGALLLGGGATFVCWLGSGTFTDIAFDRDYVILDFPWPAKDVVLRMSEVYDVSYSEVNRRLRPPLGALTIESSRGTFRSGWGGNRYVISTVGE